jgi:hypothetical protein
MCNRRVSERREVGSGAGGSRERAVRSVLEDEQEVVGEEGDGDVASGNWWWGWWSCIWWIACLKASWSLKNISGRLKVLALATLFDCFRFGLGWLGALGFVSAESDIFSLIYFIEVVLLEFPSPPRKGFVFEIPINQTKPNQSLNYSQLFLSFVSLDFWTETIMGLLIINQSSFI